MNIVLKGGTKSDVDLFSNSECYFFKLKQKLQLLAGKKKKHGTADDSDGSKPLH